MAKPTALIQQTRRRAAWLYVVNGQEAGRDFRLGSITTIGRDATCDIILPSDGKISVQHARIRREGEVFVLHDLASLNGTFVNNKKVQKQLLSDDDEVLIGRTKLIFKITPKSSD